MAEAFILNAAAGESAAGGSGGGGCEVDPPPVWCW